MSAWAQAPSPEIGTLTLPVTLRGELLASREHGCSQSWEVSSSRTDLELRVDARGHAELALEDHDETVTGSRSSGGSSAIHEHTRELWSGTATLAGGVLRVSLDRATRASARWQGPGTLPLSSPAPYAGTATLECRIARVDVLPATLRPGETPRTLSLAACTLPTSSGTLGARASEGVHLGLHRGVVSSHDDTIWGAPTRDLRLAE